MSRTEDFVRVYRDASGQWRWRRRAANGEIIATSGEGYTSYAHCKKMAEEVNSDVTNIVVTSEFEQY